MQIMVPIPDRGRGGLVMRFEGGRNGRRSKMEGGKGRRALRRERRRGRERVCVCVRERYI
jgi:hypothetical protein